MSTTLTTPANDNHKPHLAQETGNHFWYTPPKYIELARSVLGKIDLDPSSDVVGQATVKAGKYFTAADCSLEQEWHGNVWLNPPYDRGLIDRFVEKLCSELDAG